MASGYPSVGEVLRAVQMPSTQESLGAAATALAEAKTDTGEFKPDAVRKLDDAIRHYTVAEGRADLAESQKATLYLQLGKAHGQRAIAEYCPSILHRYRGPNVDCAHHHLAQSAQFLTKFRECAEDRETVAQKLLVVSEKLANLCDGSVPEPGHRRSLISSFLADILGGEVSSYEGTRLPRVVALLYLSKLDFLRCVRCVHEETTFSGAVYNELRQLTKSEQRIDDDDDSVVKGWVKLRQHADSALQELKKVKEHLDRLEGEGAEGEGCADKLAYLKATFEALLEQVQVLKHTSMVVGQLAAAARLQRQAFQNSAEMDMEKCFEVVDLFRAAERESCSPTDASPADVELQCISTHFLASMLHLMGFTEKARKMHVLVLTTALSLDAASTEWDRPTPFLGAKPWFIESKNVVEKAQREDREAAESQAQKDRETIAPEVAALKKSRNECSNSDGDDDPRPFMKFVLEKHQPKHPVSDEVRSAVQGSQAITRKVFLRLMSQYHTDKLGPSASKREQLLYKEIMVLFNSIYEKNFK